jgi:hypothetical protein
MPRPDVADLTDRLYDRLPAMYRDADEPLDFPLLRWLSLLLDPAGELDVLHDRLAPADLTDTSELADPATADLAWLPWLAQMVGVRLSRDLTGQAARDAVQFASSGYRGGTKAAVADAAKSELTGTRYAQVFDHSTDASVIGAAGEWDVLIVTRTTETPSVARVLDAVVAKRAKPVGVVLYHRAYNATWGQVQTVFPTWADWNGRTWAQIQEAGL